MEHKDKPQNILDGDIIGLVVGIGLVYLSAQFAATDLKYDDFSAVTADSVAGLLAVGGVGAALKSLSDRVDNSDE